MRRGFKTWAEQESVRRRVQANLGADAPLPARKLGELLNVPVITPRDVGMSERDLSVLLKGEKSRWSAMTLYPDGVPLVIYNPSHSAVRQETDIMHEFAHIICKHPAGKVLCGGGLPIVLREYNREHEEEADWLAGTLKVPRDGMVSVLRLGATTDDLARHFECSVSLARMRRNRTGVDLQLARSSSYGFRIR